MMPINKKVYPPNWDTEIRPRILDRAGHRCEHCGCDNYTVGYRNRSGKLHALIVGESYREARHLKLRMMRTMRRKLIAVRLTVAHLDHDEWNKEVTDDRLAALCEYCHLNYDRNDNIKRKKYGKHYARRQLSLV